MEAVAWDANGLGAVAKDGASTTSYYHTGSLRAGQNLVHDGTIVVYGDVNQDALVKAGGDVIVWGCLRGEASAGENAAVGPRAQIMALQMDPTQLSIGGVRAYGPKQEEGASAPPPAFPEKAVVCVTETDLSYIRILPAQTTLAAADKNAAPRKKNLGAIKTSYVTGAYISAVGAALMAAPMTIFGLLFDVRFISPGWIRVFGVLCVTFGMYYLGTAYGDQLGANARAFYVSTVIGRLFLFLAFGALVATNTFPEPMLLVLGFVNFFGAMVMLNALRTR